MAHDKSGYIAFGNNIIDLSEVAHYHKDATPIGEPTLNFLFKSGKMSVQHFSNGAEKSIPDIEKMIYGYFGMKSPDEFNK